MNIRFVILLSCLIPFGSVIGQTSIRNSKHDLSVTSAGATIKAQTEQEVCVFCHTPHRSSTIAQLWNRDTTTATYTLYSSDYLMSKTYLSPSQPNTKSKLCMSCHDGTIALGAVYNTSGTGTAGPIPMSGGVTSMPAGSAGYLGTVLTDDHPVGYGYDNAKDPELVVRTWPWDTPVKLDPDASTGKVECHTCHDPHNNQYGHFTRVSNSNAGLCIFCHNKTGWTAAVHKTSGQTYTPPGETATTIGEWACRNCHKPHGGTGSPYILQSSEENTCYASSCHGTTPSPATKDIKTMLDKTFRHPTNTASGKHKNPETATSLADRHSECPDCHTPHQADNGTHDGTTRNLSGVLKGTWGVEPSPWPSAPTGMLNNNNSFVIPSVASYAVRNPATSEYQICLKCHSNYTTQPVGQRNLAAEINPNYPSYHGIVAGGTSNPYCDATTMNAPWGTNKIVWCSDCHGSNTTGDPEGPHGSNLDHILVASVTSDAINGTPLCFVCHKITNYWTGQIRTKYAEHPGSRTNHQRITGCFTCHMYDFSDYGSTTGGNSKVFFVHGQNKRFYWRENAASTLGFGQNADAFINGYIADIDFVGQSCYSENRNGFESAANCGRSHTGQSYSIDP